LFEETIERNKELCNAVLIAVNKEQLPLAQSQANGMGIEELRGVVEPTGRNTAPAIALALMGLDPEEIVLVTPSDHRISALPEYRRALLRGAELADQGFLVTFGIKPQYPETGFGYIEADGEKVLSFKEKPNLRTAQAYCVDGGYYWNSGMFIFKAGVFLQELEFHSPELFDAAKRANLAAEPAPLLQPTVEAMLEIPSLSIDYAVMEKSKNIRVVPCEPGWSDLGSFDALYSEAVKATKNKNAVFAPQSLVVDSEGCLVMGEEKPIVIDGLKDIIIIDTKNALLIMKRGESQRVKSLYAKIKEKWSDLT
jgi:mannose-1-phosphate guanylyltransferase